MSLNLPGEPPFTLLRYGMPADKDIIADPAIKALYDAIVIPAHILAFFHEALPAFLYGLEKPYIVDPMTYMYQSVRSYSDEWGTRRSARKLAEAYGGEFARMVAEAAESHGTDVQGEGRSAEGSGEQRTLRLLNPENILASLGRGCVVFQDEVVADVVRRLVGRYVAVSRTLPTPAVLLAPYFYFKSVRDPWYAACVTLQGAALDEAQRRGTQILPVICTQVACLEEAFQREALLADCGRWPADVVVLWLNGFSQSGAQEPQIRALADFVGELHAQHKKQTLMLYGGYMCMLMTGNGLAGVSHGMLYGEHKEVRRLPPGGPPPDRYYFPLFHDFRKMSHAVRIMQEVDSPVDLMCECPICSEVLAGDPRNLPLMWRTAALKRHFLQARNNEKEATRGTALPEALDALRVTYERYNDTVRAIPNPDTRDLQFLPDLEYLRKWATALSAP